MDGSTLRGGFGLLRVNGQLQVEVPYAQADACQARLKRQGLAAALYLDPASREARLVLWVDPAPDQVWQLLAGGGD
jgi:hypothetical protein